MNPITCSLSDSDIEVITFALTIFPSLGIEKSEIQAIINYQCCCSVGEKLIMRRTDITPNEYRVIWLALHSVDLINRGELDVDLETKKECSSYFFTVNKLLPFFDELVS